MASPESQNSAEVSDSASNTPSSGDEAVHSADEYDDTLYDSDGEEIVGYDPRLDNAIKGERRNRPSVDKHAESALRSERWMVCSDEAKNFALNPGALKISNLTGDDVDHVLVVLRTIDQFIALSDHHDASENDMSLTADKCIQIKTKVDSAKELNNKLPQMEVRYRKAEYDWRKVDESDFRDDSQMSNVESSWQFYIDKQDEWLGAKHHIRDTKVEVTSLVGKVEGKAMSSLRTAQRDSFESSGGDSAQLLWHERLEWREKVIDCLFVWFEEKVKDFKAFD